MARSAQSDIASRRYARGALVMPRHRTFGLFGWQHVLGACERDPFARDVGVQHLLGLALEHSFCVNSVGKGMKHWRRRWDAGRPPEQPCEEERRGDDEVDEILHLSITPDVPGWFRPHMRPDRACNEARDKLLLLGIGMNGSAAAPSTSPLDSPKSLNSVPTPDGEYFQTWSLASPTLT